MTGATGQESTLYPYCHGRCSQGGILAGPRFVLTGVWPFQGGGHGLALGKDRVKSRIEKFGGTVTMSISRLTDALVVGDAPGPKKVIEAHNQSMKIIITLAQVNDLILGDLILEDLLHPIDRILILIKWLF